ncbi:MAG: hypothetical protein E7634_02750 [Ruminococcaceae bacterium]|nr:hypothetical protein [Oscillospiraceae bacterium]
MKKLSVLMILIAGLSWGSSCLFVDTFTSMGFSSIQCTSIRLIFSLPFFHLILLSSGVKNYKISFKSLIIFICSGFFSVLAMCACYYFAIANTSAAVAAVLLDTAPVFVMIMSAIFFKEKITLKKAIVLIITVIGTALASGIVGGIKGSVIGVAIGLLSGFTYALYSILTPFALKEKNSPMACTAFSFTFAALASTLIAPPADIINTVSKQPNLPLTILFFFFFSLITAVLPFGLYTYALVHIKPDVASLLATSEPITATIFGATVLAQKLDIFQIVGILLVIGAISSLNISFKSKRKISA